MSPRITAAVLAAFTAGVLAEREWQKRRDLRRLHVIDAQSAADDVSINLTNTLPGPGLIRELRREVGRSRRLASVTHLRRDGDGPGDAA